MNVSLGFVGATSGNFQLKSNRLQRSRQACVVRASASRPPSSRTPLLSRFLSFVIREALLSVPEASFRDLDVDVASRSSWDLLQGRCDGIELNCGRFKYDKIQAQRLRVASDPIIINSADMLRGGPPSFQSDFYVRSEITFGPSDFVPGTLVSNILEDMVKELIRTGISGAMGRWVPSDVGGLNFTIGGVTLENSTILMKVFLNTSDGSRFPLNIRTGFRVSKGGRMVSLEYPELLVKEPFLGNTITIPFLTVALIGFDLGEELSIEEFSISSQALYLRSAVKVPKEPFRSQPPMDRAPPRRKLKGR